MQVRDVMTRDVRTCHPGDTLERAAGLFWEYDCGCAPVVDESERVLGMLTDRDVCIAAYTRGKPLREIDVAAAMGNGGRTVLTCRADDTIATAETILRKNQVRRLPVTDSDGRLVGLLSLNDLACEARRERGQKKKEVSDAEVGETLAAICEHRARGPVS